MYRAEVKLSDKELKLMPVVLDPDTFEARVGVEVGDEKFVLVLTFEQMQQIREWIK